MSGSWARIIRFSTYAICLSNNFRRVRAKPASLLRLVLDVGIEWSLQRSLRTHYRFMQGNFSRTIPVCLEYHALFYYPALGDLLYISSTLWKVKPSTVNDFAIVFNALGGWFLLFFMMFCTVFPSWNI